MVLVQADHSTNVLGGGGVIAGQQHDLQAQGLHLADGLGRGLLNHIRHADDACRFTGQREVQRGHTVAAHLFARPLQVGGQLAGLADKIGVAARDDLTGHLALQTLAGHSLKIGNGGVGELVLFGLFQNGTGQRVLTAQFQASGHAEQELGRHVAGTHDLDHAGFAGGDGAGLIQQHSIGVAGGFQAGGGLEQDAVFGAHTAANHDGNRRCQAQRAGAADDQHTDTAGQRVSEGLAQQQPDNERQQGDAGNSGYEDAGDFIRRFGQRGLGSGGVPHQADDLGQGGVLANTLGPAGQGAVLVDGGGADRRTGKFIHRHALAGQGGLVHAGNALGNGAVHRDGFTRAYQKQIPDLHLADRQRYLLAIAQHTGCLRGQLHQALQRIGGLALAVSFQRFSDGDQRQNRGSRLKIEVMPILHDQLHIVVFQANVDHHNSIQAV